MSQATSRVHAGNYDTYMRTRGELEENQMKKFKWEQEQIKDMKEYIARFGHGSAKLARQAQSKEKTLAKMVSQSPTSCLSASTIHICCLAQSLLGTACEWMQC